MSAPLFQVDSTANGGTKLNSEFYVDTANNGSNEFEINSGDVHVKGRELKVDVDNDGTSELWVQAAQTQVRNLLEADAGVSFDNGSNTLDHYSEGSGVLTFSANQPGYSVDPTLDYRVARVGNIVTLHLDDFTGTPDVGAANYFRTATAAIPAAFQPWKTVGIKVKVVDAGTSSDGYMEISSTGRVSFFKNNASNFSNQTAAANTIGDASISYCVA